MTHTGMLLILASYWLSAAIGQDNIMTGNYLVTSDRSNNIWQISLDQSTKLMLNITKPQSTFDMMAVDRTSRNKSLVLLLGNSASEGKFQYTRIHNGSFDSRQISADANGKITDIAIDADNRLMYYSTANGDLVCQNITAVNITKKLVSGKGPSNPITTFELTAALKIIYYVECTPQNCGIKKYDLAFDVISLYANLTWRFDVMKMDLSANEVFGVANLSLYKAAMNTWTFNEIYKSKNGIITDFALSSNQIYMAVDQNSYIQVMQRATQQVSNMSLVGLDQPKFLAVQEDKVTPTPMTTPPSSTTKKSQAAMNGATSLLIVCLSVILSVS